MNDDFGVDTSALSAELREYNPLDSVDHEWHLPYGLSNTIFTGMMGTEQDPESINYTAIDLMRGFARGLKELYPQINPSSVVLRIPDDKRTLIATVKNGRESDVVPVVFYRDRPEWWAKGVRKIGDLVGSKKVSRLGKRKTKQMVPSMKTAELQINTERLVATYKTMYNQVFVSVVVAYNPVEDKVYLGEIYGNYDRNIL